MIVFGGVQVICYRSVAVRKIRSFFPFFTCAAAMYPERKVKLIFSTSAGKEKEEKRILEVLLEPLYLLKFYSRLYWPWTIYMCVIEIFINKSKRLLWSDIPPCYYDSMFFIWRSLFSSPSPLGRFLKNLQLGLKRKKWLATSLQHSVTFWAKKPCNDVVKYTWPERFVLLNKHCVFCLQDSAKSVICVYWDYDL